MPFEHEKREALRMLQGIEDGTMTAMQSHDLLRDADPALVYFVFTWLREHYHRSHPAAEAVLGRVAAICVKYPAVTRQIKAGESDAVVSWFQDAYSYRDLDARGFIDLVVDKLES